MTDKCDISNPNNLPLEEFSVEINNSGILQQVKALDPFWAEKKQLTMYERPPSGINLVLGSLDTWKSKMQKYLEDLKWLLAMEHNCFWSTIVYHPECMDMLVSFLQEANPPYMPSHDDRKVRNMYNEIRKYILIVFSRFITNKESKKHWMSKEFMKDLLYDNFVFTIPILWDIALIYGTNNREHVEKIITSVFALQPKYLVDLEAAIAFTKEAFKYIILQVNKHYDATEPPNLSQTFKGFSEIRRPSQNSTNQNEKLTFTILKDLVIHLLDTVLTIRIFCELYPKAVDILKKRGFVLSLVQLYEYAIPYLYEKLEELGDQTSVTYTEVQTHIDSARAEIIDIFREILAVSKNAIFHGEDSIQNHVEEYLSVMMDGLSEKLMIKDYHSCYPIQEDLDMLKQAYPNIDPVKTDFILQAVYSTIDDTIPDSVPTNSELNHPILNGHQENVVSPSTLAENEIPNNVKEDSLISEVKDIFPDLGDGFVLKCLRHYKLDSARVINSILEDNLDESLKSIDRSLPIIPEDPLDSKFLETGIERLNVFDGDEFDIMTRDDVDVSKIHIGKKKSKYKDLKDMLNDKSAIQEVKKKSDLYNKYDLVCDEVNMYSDEYDDTYDEEGAGPSTPAVDEDPRRPLVTPRVLRADNKPAKEEAASSSESETDEPTPSHSGRGRLEFCVNPEVARARREANMQLRQNKRTRAPTKSSDVVGKARGQGQEKEVLVNREKKEKHKSSRANHNRRQGAQWKRSQGLVPS